MTGTSAKYQRQLTEPSREQGFWHYYLLQIVIRNMKLILQESITGLGNQETWFKLNLVTVEIIFTNR